MSECEKGKPEFLTIPSRNLVLECLENCRKDLHAKVKTGRIKDQSLERARNEKIRLLIYCCSTMAGIMKDREMDALHEKIKHLEEENRSSNKTPGEAIVSPEDLENIARDILRIKGYTVIPPTNEVGLQ